MPEPFYCGFCVGALDGARCPHCKVDWAEPLTETEARAFRAGWNSKNSDDPILDAWRAVRMWREHGRPLNLPAPQRETIDAE